MVERPSFVGPAPECTGISDERRYQIRLTQLRERVEALCPPGTIFTIGTLSDPDAHEDLRCIAVQGEYVDRVRAGVRDCLVSVRALTGWEYNFALEMRRQSEPATPDQQRHLPEKEGAYAAA